MFWNKSSIAHHHEKLEKLHKKIHRKRNFFPGQRENEEVQICIRTHWIQRLIIFWRFLLLGIIAPLIIFYFFTLVNIPMHTSVVVNLLVLAYLMLIWLLTFIEFIKTEFNVLVATNERIVDITQTSLFNRKISETNLDRIQEVTGRTRGILGSVLDIGRLEIQTAGNDVLMMHFVKFPQLTARKILDIQKESQQRRRTSDFGKRIDDRQQTRKGETFSAEELKKMRGQSKKDSSRQRKQPGTV